MIEKFPSQPNPSPNSAATSACTDGVKIRDVADFHLRWPEFRPLVVKLGRQGGLSPAEADTLSWMIELMDRIGPKDLEDPESP